MTEDYVLQTIGHVHFYQLLHGFQTAMPSEYMLKIPVFLKLLDLYAVIAFDQPRVDAHALQSYW